MDIYSELVVALNDAGVARTWLQELVTCHDEIVADSKSFDKAVYPFFTFLCLNGFTLLAIYHSDTNIMLVGLEIPDQEMIEMGNRLAMSDVPQVEEFLGSNARLIRFGESVTLMALGAKMA
ncbi:MAG: hypothetical protein AAFR75_00250 [Pseudomonadota bacterium]